MRGPQLLRTRVARRILLLFLVCAMLPVATFAILAYRVTASRLRSDAESSLRQDSKTAGMILIDRLHVLVSELGSAGARSSFAAIGLQQRDGRIEGARDLMPSVPALTKAQQTQLSLGMPVVLVDTARGTPWIVVVVPAPGDSSGFPRRVGLLAPTVLVGTDPDLSPAPAGAELCVRDDLGRGLYCPADGAPSHFAAGSATADGAQTWERGDSSFLMARWSLFLGREFASPPWTITLSVPQTRVLAALRDFRRTFFLGVALATVLVFVLSHVQLRKRMTPLAELEAGVHRLGDGDFTTPVVVRSDDEFELLAKSFNGMASDLRDQFMTLKALSAVDVAALETRSALAIAGAALQCAPALLGASRAAVAFSTGGTTGSWTILSMGPDGAGSHQSLARPSAGEILQLEATTDALHFTPGTSGYACFEGAHAPRESRRVVFPLRENGRVQAALIISGDGLEFAPKVMARGRQLADQLAVGLSNVSLLDELDALSHGSMLALARTIDAASPWTAGHSERVTQGALEIARRLGVGQTDLDRLRRGGLLHDIGKIGVPAAILDKPGRLTPEERKIIETHPVIGAQIIKPIAAFHELRPLVLYHHELMDGSGYPEGLAGDSIPALVRVLTVADIYDALVSDRPYRAGLEPAAALKILQGDAGTKFDKRMVRCLEEAIADGWSAKAMAEPSTDRSTRSIPLEGAPWPPLREEVFS